MEPLSGRTFRTLNPATNQALDDVAAAQEEDVDRAVAAAMKALEGPWGTMELTERAAILRKAAILISERAEELADSYMRTR